MENKVTKKSAIDMGVSHAKQDFKVGYDNRFKRKVSEDPYNYDFKFPKFKRLNELIEFLKGRCAWRRSLLRIHHMNENDGYGIYMKFPKLYLETYHEKFKELYFKRHRRLR